MRGTTRQTARAGDAGAPDGKPVALEPLEARRLFSISIHAYPLPTGTSFPNHLTVGPGGVWFTNDLAAKVGYITPGGAIKLFNSAKATGTKGASGITLGPDGNIWFGEHYSGVVAKITAKGVITAYTLPGTFKAPDSMTTGADGNIYFANFFGEIGRFSPTGIAAGQVSYFPHTGATPGKLLAYAKAVYFIEGNQIGRMNTAGQYTADYAVPSGGAVQDITVGPDNNLWFTENRLNSASNFNYVGYLTPAGVVKEFRINKANGDLSGIAAGGNGNLYVRQGDFLIGVNTSGKIVNSQNLEFIAGGGSVVKTKDGNVWYAEGVKDKIGVAFVGAAPVAVGHVAVGHVAPADDVLTVSARQHEGLFDSGNASVLA